MFELLSHLHQHSPQTKKGLYQYLYLPDILDAIDLRVRSHSGSHLRQMCCQTYPSSYGIATDLDNLVSSFAFNNFKGSGRLATGVSIYGLDSGPYGPRLPSEYDESNC